MLDPDREPPATDLDVDVETEESEWSVERTDRKGELYTRIVLDTELSNDAAAGWSGDELVAFADENDQDAFVWTSQWKSEDDADAFAAAFETKLDSRTDDWADRTTVERVDDRTVSVVIGPDEFQGAIDLTATNGTIELILGDGMTAAPSLALAGTASPSVAESPATTGFPITV